MTERSDETGGSGLRNYAPKLAEVEMIFKISRVELHHNMLKMISLKLILVLITSRRVCQTEIAILFTKTRILAS